MKRRRKKLGIISSILVFVTFLSGMGMTNLYYGAEKASISITGLKKGDLVEIYRIASYEEEEDTYEWENTVKDWIQNKSEGNAYKGMKPAQLSKMTEERIEEFCQALVVNLKNEAKGIANLDGYAFTIEEEKEQYIVENIVPGYYIILPKGTDRIYEIKWMKALPGQACLISYDERAGDYQLPTITSLAVNKTEDRGVVGDGVFLIQGDEVEITSTIQVPIYPNMYATGKRILNVTIVVPKGLEYKKDSIKVSMEAESLYSIGTYNKAILYETRDGTILFFGTPEGYFYELNGNLLVSSGTPENALEKYNEKYKSKYTLPMESDTSQDKEKDEVENTESVTESTETGELVSDLVAEDDSMELRSYDGRTVLVIAVDTEQEIEELEISYEVVKNTATSGKGDLNNYIGLSYSVSPLDSNRMNTMISQTDITAYSITIISCEGSGESANWTPEEKLKYSPRFKGVMFTIYRLVATLDGNVTESYSMDTTEESTDTEKEHVFVYDDKADKTYEYEYFAAVMTNSKGEASIGGLEPAEYMIEQTIYPTGYTLSDASFVIKEDAWKDDSLMEGDEDLLLLWLEYKTRFLPGTGKIGILLFAVIGTFISACAIKLIFQQCYPYGWQEFLIRIKLIKELLKK